MKRKYLMLTAVLALALTVGGCSGEAGPVNVTAAKVKTESGLAENSYTGMVEAQSRVDVTSNVSGKVQEVCVKEGQRVAEGDVLFRIDSTSYTLQANQAKAALAAAQAALTSAQAQTASNASVIPAETASRDAHANYERMKTLYEAGGISQADFDGAKSKMETADAQLASARISQKSGADSAAAQVASAQAALELVSQQLADCTVKAPISGEVSQLEVELGSVVSMQVKAMAVVDNSRLKVSVDVLEKDVRSIGAGMEAEVTVQALGKTCAATVDQVAPAADPSTGMFRVTVAFDAGDSGILSGMTADVRLTGAPGSEAAAFLVPAKSVSQENGKSYVYVVEGTVVKKQEVSAGGRKNQYIEIFGGLSPEDQVVVQAGGTLSDGVQVKLIEAVQ